MLSSARFALQGVCLITATLLQCYTLLALIVRGEGALLPSLVSLVDNSIGLANAHLRGDTLNLLMRGLGLVCASTSLAILSWRRPTHRERMTSCGAGVAAAVFAVAALFAMTHLLPPHKWVQALGTMNIGTSLAFAAAPTTVLVADLWQRRAPATDLLSILILVTSCAWCVLGLVNHDVYTWLPSLISAALSGSQLAVVLLVGRGGAGAPAPPPPRAARRRPGS